MPIYNKIEIGRAAHENGFVRDTFEKVLRLKEILKYFNEEEYLSKHLLLKGGTAINLTVFDLLRLSVDIDMDYTPNDTKEDMLKTREKITALIKTYMDTEGYQLSSSSRFMHSLDAFYYQYTNAGGNRDMFRKCFVFYAIISAETVNRNFDTSAIESLSFDKIRRDLFPVLNKKDNFALEERKQQAKEYIAELMQLTEQEDEYMDRFIRKAYRPELLFEDKDILERINRHPMALWKCQ